MLNQFSRTELLLGKEKMEKLKNSHIAIFGIGGVGSFATEAIARSGIGTIDIFDDDKICLTNINRQLIANTKTIGKYKVDVMKKRILNINPKAIVNTYQCFYTADNANDFILSEYDYIIDAIDTVSSKLELITRAKAQNVPIISCMGVGNKLDPTRLEISDISKTTVCPLAKVIRKELKKRHITKVKVLFSKEEPLIPISDDSNNCKTGCICPTGTVRKCTDKRQVPGSISFVPSVAGLIIAGEVIKDISFNK